MSNSPKTSGVFGAPLEAVVFNEDLTARPFREPDYETEARTISALMQELAHSPETILQALVDRMLSAFNAHSAGISLMTTIEGEERFYWPPSPASGVVSSAEARRATSAPAAT